MLPAILRFACSTNDALERTCGTDSFATNIYGCLVHNAHDTLNNSKAIFTDVPVDEDSDLHTYAEHRSLHHYTLELG